MEDLTTNDIMHANGFINDNKSEKSNCTMINVIEYLHKKGPHIALSEFGMFDKRSDVSYESMEYLNYYDISDKSVRYLMSISYKLELDVVNMQTKFLEKEDISCSLPMYYLEIFDLSGNIIDQNDYSIEFTIFEKIFPLDIRFEKGYLIDVYPELRCFFYSDKGMNDIKEFLAKSNIEHQNFMSNLYTDCITITFNENVKFDKIIVKCKAYNIFNYVGFFGSGWSYNI
jgi:hypothetical protein